MFHLSALLFFQAYKNERYGGILCLTLSIFVTWKTYFHCVIVL